MSITILEQDNLNIIIGKWEQLTNEPWKTISNIRLFVNLQVNGKLKQLFQGISLKDGEINDWIVINTLIDTLNQLGYETPWVYDKIEKWIAKL